MIDQKLTDKTEIATISEEALIHVVEPGDISQSPAGSSYKFKAKNLSMAGQDNIRIRKYFNFPKGATLTQIVNIINLMPEFEVTEKQLVTYIGREVINSGTLFQTFTGKIVKYDLFEKGKGTYGSNFTFPIADQMITQDNLELRGSTIVTATDIAAMIDTDVFNYGDLTEQTVSEWLNAGAGIEIQPQNEGYTLFQGTIDGVVTEYLFIGEEGFYGAGQSQSTDADFQLLNDVAPTGIPTYQQTLEAYNVAVDTPAVHEDTETEQKISYSGKGLFYQRGVFTASEFIEDLVADFLLIKRAKEQDQYYAYLSDFPYLNVKDFGAKGDGVTNDTEAILATVEAAKTGTIKRVYFPTGIYMMSGRLVYYSNIEYFGDGINSEIRAHADAVTGLTPLTPINGVDSGSVDILKWRAMSATESTDFDAGVALTENVLVRNLAFNWNGISCGVNSASAIIFGRAKNCKAYGIKIHNVLPSNLNNTSNRHYGNCMLFAMAEDCSLTDSWIGASDYESVSPWFNSERTTITRNILVADKPATFRGMAHLVQAARPSPAVTALNEEYGYAYPKDTFIDNNIFLLRSNVAHAATSHSGRGFYVRNNFVKLTLNNQSTFGIKPFDGTEDFVISDNVIDMREYITNQVGASAISLGTSIASGNPVRNGKITNNTILIKNTVPVSGAVTYPNSPVLGGHLTPSFNVEISGNLVEIDGYDNTPRFIVSASGDGCKIFGNVVTLKNPLVPVTSAGMAFCKISGGNNTYVDGNTITGSELGRGIVIDSVTQALGKLNIGSKNMYPTIIGNKITNTASSGTVQFDAESVNGIFPDENGNITLTAGAVDAVPYTGATSDIELGDHYVASEETVGNEVRRGVVSNASSTISRNDAVAQTSKSAIHNHEKFLVSSSASNGAVQSSVQMTVVDVTKPTIKTATEGLSFDIPAGKEMKYELPPTLDSYLSIPHKEYVDDLATTKADLDVNGKVPLSQINDALLGNVIFKGLYDGATITFSPDADLIGDALPAASTDNVGWYFISTGAFTNGGINYAVGDWIISIGSSWAKVDNTDAVSSVAGKVGVVTLDIADITGLVTSLAGKEALLGTANTSRVLRGDKAWTSILNGFPLSSFTAAPGIVTDADHFLGAFQKIVGNLRGTVNTTTAALSAADLNTAYGSAGEGFRVYCKDIVGGGLVYTKIIESGSSDTWISTPLTVVT